MQNCQAEMKKAVECGYWNLFRFNPTLMPGKKFVARFQGTGRWLPGLPVNKARVLLADA